MTRATFVVTGDTYDIDDWYKEAEDAAGRNHVVIEDVDLSQVDEIANAFKTLERYDKDYYKFLVVDDKRLFAMIPATESIGYQVYDCEFPCYSRTHKKEYKGIRFVYLEDITKEEYEKNKGAA